MGHLRILFVCIGNTCRSPMAEGVMKHLAQKNGLDWFCDSAGLRSWNVGITPEERCMKMLGENGMTLQHSGRMITQEDFQNFDYIFGMDESNLSELEAMAKMLGKTCRAKVGLLGTYLEDENMEIIRDPYFSNGIDAFRAAYEQIFGSCEKFIEKHRLDAGCPP